MIQDSLSPKHGQLSCLYLKWKNSPSEYGKEMADTVDKIIYSTLCRQSLEPVYWRVEDRDDLIQELRLLCFQKLNKIRDPSNKRIFNFLRVSIKLALRDKCRKVGRRLDREASEAELLKEKIVTPTSLFYFGDNLLEQVATLLSEGETKEQICDTLSITNAKLTKQIERLRRVYSGKK